MTIRIRSLHVYPVKACAGIDMASVAVDGRGLVGDRNWMIVDADGRALTQREAPSLATISVKLDGERFVLSRGDHELTVARDTLPTRRVVRVWSFTGDAEDLGDEVALWLSVELQRSCRLVRFADDVVREVSRKHAPDGGRVAFADAYPILLVSQEALDALNDRLPEPVSMKRFRPNIVVEGCAAHAEDTWRRISVGGIALDVVKPCDRCSVPGVDPLTGIPGKEPLRSLASYRRREDGKIYFGQNCVPRALGTISVGDPVAMIA